LPSAPAFGSADHAGVTRASDKIAATPLIYRNLAFTTNFIEQHPQGIDASDYVAKADYETWVQEKWGDDEA
jgi:hypothetical protein